METRLRFAVVTLVWLAIPVAAQESLSTLRGTVTDQSGAIVPGVTVTVDEIATNIRVRSVITNHQGNYEMPGLKQGRYRLAVRRFRLLRPHQLVRR